MLIKNPTDDKFDIIIVAGQSNALGCGIGETEKPFIPNERIMMLNEDFTADFIDDNLIMENSGNCYIAVADDRVENGQKKASFCLSFAQNYLKNNLDSDRKILLVQTAVGGTGFAKKHWGENEKLTVRMFEMVNMALAMNKENKVVAVLWHQGEHDMYRNESLTYKEKYVFYFNKLYYFIKNLREVYGSVPFISGGFCPSWTAQNKISSVNAINDAYKNLNRVFEKIAHVWKVDDLKSNNDMVKCGDVIHFCRDSSYKLGRRFYKEYKNIIS